MSAQAEPTIEDILASIRKIIAEDDEAEAGRTSGEAQTGESETIDPDPEPEPELAAAPEKVSAPAEKPTGSLSSALMAKAEEAAARPQPVTPSHEDDDVLNLTQIIDDDGGVRDLATMSTKEKRALRAVDQAVATEVANAFAAIRGAMDDAQREDPSAALEFEGDDALAQAVEDTVRPLVKSWLDANLAPLVERIVREQVQALARR